jgi:hypothetical protein
MMIAITILTILFSVLIGLTIVKVVEARMTDISINMPKITLPQIQVTIKDREQLQTGGGSGTTPSALQFDPSRYHSLSCSVPKPISTTEPARYDKEAVSQEPVARQPEALTEPEVAGLGTGTYYMDPKDMNAAQLVKFQHRAKFENMTVKDYERWLLTFRTTETKLSEFHRNNLKILLRGGHLIRSDLPVGRSRGQ